MKNSMKIAAGLGVAAMALALCSCGGGGDDEYVPEPTAAEWTTYNTYVLQHPGQECVMTWGAGLYVNNCYPMGATIPYSYHVYYPRTGYCGCWHVATMPPSYRVTYVSKKTYVPGRTTNVTVNRTVTTTRTTTSGTKSAPQDKVPPGYKPAGSSSGTRSTTTRSTTTTTRSTSVSSGRR